MSVSSPEEAVADLGGIRKAVNVSLIDDPKPGDWVIIHVGFALQRIDEEQAQETLRALEAAARSGEALQGAGAAA